MKTAWVLTGDGINCEIETAEACRRAGFVTEIVHLKEAIGRSLDDCSLLVIPGGFSFGDELGSGRMLSLQIQHLLKWDLRAFVQKEGVVIGICNGFQALMQLGIFGSSLALAHNDHGRFINAWVELEVEDESERYGSDRYRILRGLKKVDFPIRHGEGRIIESGHSLGNTAFPAFRYVSNPNGSHDSIAGLLDPSGRILGLMPHPEGFMRASQHPGYFKNKSQEPLSEGLGLRLFKNAFHLCRRSEKNPFAHISTKPKKRTQREVSL